MQVIVSDSSVLIDLTKARLIESAFGLPYEFVIPDVMFADELLDLGGYTRDGLLEAGLRVCGLDGEGVEAGFGYVRCYVALSNNDAFALALAKTTIVYYSLPTVRYVARRVLKMSKCTVTYGCWMKLRNTKH